MKFLLYLTQTGSESQSFQFKEKMDSVSRFVCLLFSYVTSGNRIGMISHLTDEQTWALKVKVMWTRLPVGD